MNLDKEQILVYFKMLKWAFNPNLRPKTVNAPAEDDDFNTIDIPPTRRKKIKVVRRSSTSTVVGINSRLR